MTDIIIKPEANLSNNPGKWFINQELSSSNEAFNQLLGEYLSRFLFNIPSSFSFFVNIKDGKENKIDAPFFYDQKDRRKVLVTKINDGDFIDLGKSMQETGDLNFKLNKIYRLCNSENEYLNIKETLIRLLLFDFFTGQYGRGFQNDVYLGKEKELYLSSVYGFGNSYRFDETIREKETCDSIFGTLSLEQLYQLVDSSKNKKLYLKILSQLNFSYALKHFCENSILELNDDQKNKYIDYAKEKQAVLIKLF